MGSDTEVHIKRDGINALVVPEWAEQFDPDWFDPDYWGERAVPVSSGGRGSAWFVERPEQDWVLRHYRRGGLIGRLVRDSYLYMGKVRVRSFSEFRLLTHIYKAGLPAPKPIAAMYRRNGRAYSASIIIERLQGVSPFGAIIGELTGSVWFEVGRTIRQFHDAGVCHADLNCFNIMIGEKRVFLIDFDKGKLVSGSLSDARWKAENLARLRRSVEKLTKLKADQRWSALLKGYNSQ